MKVTYTPVEPIVIVRGIYTIELSDDDAGALLCLLGGISNHSNNNVVGKLFSELTKLGAPRHKYEYDYNHGSYNLRNAR